MWLVFVFGAHCISYSGGGGTVFALVNLQVALVFCYGKSIYIPLHEPEFSIFPLLVDLILRDSLDEL